MTLNLVTTCDLVTILERPFFNLLHKIIRLSDILRDLVTVFAETKSVTKSRLHCNSYYPSLVVLQVGKTPTNGAIYNMCNVPDCSLKG